MIRLALTLGLLVGSALVPLAAGAPTLVSYDASTCPAGTYTVRTTLTDPNSNTYQAIRMDVVLPQATLTQTYPDLPPTTYVARTTATRSDGQVWTAEVVNVTGLGTAPVPVPAPTPTPTVTPSPTPTPTPTVTPSPTPTPGQSPDCTKAATVTDAVGSVWTIAAGSTWTLRNGAFSLSPGTLPGAQGSVYLMVGGVTHVLDPRDSQWYRWNETAKTWTLVGATEPVCATPTPTPTPTPTVTPSPTPTPVDMSQVLAAIQQQTNALLVAIAGVTPAPVPTVTCSITAVSSYTNGDQRLTVRCAPSGFATGQNIKVIK